MKNINIWNNPIGYHKTSQKLQKKYLELLVNRGDISGNILDIGCGTGNAIQLLEKCNNFKYTGIDISDKMIDYAKKNNSSSENLNFIVGDFLEIASELGNDYDHVICAACLHWFHPKQNEVISKIKKILKIGGGLHLSTALSFKFIPGEGEVQKEVIEMVRKKFEPISEINTFQSRRLTQSQIIKICAGFGIEKVSTHEEIIYFSNYMDFKDWHVGSGSVVYEQFGENCKEEAVDMYYKLMYDKYILGEYKVAYGTALINLTNNY